MENVTAIAENVTVEEYVYEDPYEYPDYLYDYFSETVSNVIKKAGFPVIGIFTPIGNIFVILVMLRPAYWNIGSTSVMIILMAGTDMWSVFLSYSRGWSYENFGMDLRSINLITCKLHTWQTYASVFFKPGLFIGVMFERTASLYWKEFHKKLTRKVMMIYAGCYLIGAYLLTISKPIFTILYDDGWCYHQFEWFPTTIFTWLDLVFSTLMPTSLLALMCVMMIVRVSLNHRDLPRPLTQQQKDRKSLSLMMLIRTLIFFCANLPIVALMNDGITGWDVRILADDWNWIAMWRLLFTISVQLLYIGAFLNFPVYMCFSRFRNEFIEMIRTCNEWCYCAKKLKESKMKELKGEDNV